MSIVLSSKSTVAFFVWFLRSNGHSEFGFGTVNAVLTGRVSGHVRSCERAMRAGIGATLRSRAFGPMKPLQPPTLRIRSVDYSKRFSHGKDSVDM